MNDGDVTILSQGEKICDWRVKPGTRKTDAIYTLKLHGIE